MVLQVSTSNDVTIYSITSAGKSAIPDWLANQKKKSLKHDSDYQRRIELIQDFEFPEASLKIKVTPDRRNIIASGTYKPQIRVYELSDLSMKFDRHTDSENVQFEMLSQDWTKMLFLQNDRTIEFHTQSGMHHKTRIPKFGRDIAYHFQSCDVLAVGASSSVYRINLERGQFMAPLETDIASINVCEINPAHQLFGFGGENGSLELWHPTQRKKIGQISVMQALSKVMDLTAMKEVAEISSLKFANDGLTFAVGTSTGHVLLYDLRNPTPILVKDHQYGYAIKSINFHESGNIVSADTKIIKVWDKNNGNVFTNIEPPNDINDVAICQESGLLMVANEGTKIQSYYIPALGPAPGWCPFLDNLTEELEEKTNQVIYDDYKFVTKKELNALSMDHLIGTSTVKAYMHGFFIDLRLYEKAKAITNPFDYDNFRRQQIQTKIEKERSTRIGTLKKLPKINKNLAQKLLTSEELADKKKKSKSGREGVTEENPTGDNRFKDLFVDADYEVDEAGVEYRLRHPAVNNKVVESKDEQASESESEVMIKKTDKKIVHPLIENKVDASKELAFGSRVSVMEKRGKQDRMSGNKNGNASVTFAQPKGTKFVKNEDETSFNRKKRGVGQLRLPKK